jgi:hypothetical protein
VRRISSTASSSATPSSATPLRHRHVPLTSINKARKPGNRSVMRLIHVLNMLGMACATLTAFEIIANGFQGYPPPGRPTALPYGLELYGKVLLFRWLSIFWLSALFATAGFFVNRKNQATRYPGLMIGLIIALILSYARWGTKVGS